MEMLLVDSFEKWSLGENFFPANISQITVPCTRRRNTASPEINIGNATIAASLHFNPCSHHRFTCLVSIHQLRLESARQVSRLDYSPQSSRRACGLHNRFSSGTSETPSE